MAKEMMNVVEVGLIQGVANLTPALQMPCHPKGQPKLVLRFRIGHLDRAKGSHKLREGRIVA
jgi:hypothetical protein